MGLFRSVVKKVAIAAVVMVGKRIANKVVGKVAEKIKTPPVAK